MNKGTLQKFPWLVYSASNEGFFCKYCALFSAKTVGATKCSQNAGKLVNTPLTAYKKLTGKDGALTVHESSSYHKSSMESAQNFLLTTSIFLKYHRIDFLD